MPDLRCSRGARIAALVTALLATAPSSGEELVTDRPDFTESPLAVPAGTVQVEGGFTWVEAPSGQETLSAPETLVRWGLSERVELRFGLPDRIDPERGRPAFGDGSFGAKFELGESASGWTSAVIATVSLPVGDRELTSDEIDPGVIVTTGRDLSAGWSLGTQASWSITSAGADDVDTIGATVVVARSIASRTGTFFELAFEEVDREGGSLLLHHGYTHLLGDRLQLDLHAAVGLTDDAPDALIGAGVSWRSR